MVVSSNNWCLREQVDVIFLELQDSILNARDVAILIRGLNLYLQPNDCQPECYDFLGILLGKNRHRPYVRLARYVKHVVHGMAHITGGGLVGNIPRVLPKGCDAAIKKSSWPKHKIFTFLQNKGPVEEAEMFRVFNMGIGFVLVVAEDFADSIARELTKYGEKVFKIGRITTGTGKVVLK